MTYSKLRELCICKIDEILHDEEIFNRMYSQVISMEPEKVRKEQFLHICAGMEDSYRTFLKEQWYLYRNDDEREFYEIMDRPYARVYIDCNYREQLASSLADAQEETWWEKITDTNCHDEEKLKMVILEYAFCLLNHMKLDFLEDVPSRPARKMAFKRHS